MSLVFGLLQSSTWAGSVILGSVRRKKCNAGVSMLLPVESAELI